MNMNREGRSSAKRFRGHLEPRNEAEKEGPRRVGGRKEGKKERRKEEGTRTRTLQGAQEREKSSEKREEV